MIRILHLEDDKKVRSKLIDVLKGRDIEVTSCSTLSEAYSRTEGIDLYICGQHGKYSDGLIFALDMVEKNQKVLIMSQRQKFSRLPFVSYGELSKPESVFRKISDLLEVSTVG